ncbi:MAG: hypothetical protein AAB495_01265 [Patescibacteria group bacterium]
MSKLDSWFRILDPMKKGQTTLSITFIIGGIILLIGTTLAFLALTFLNSSFGYIAANKAIALADGGVNDAVMLLLRNKDFSDSGYCAPLGGSPCATVTITQNSPSTGLVTITSEATISRYRRKIEAVTSVASSTGEVNLLSWQLLSL